MDPQSAPLYPSQGTAPPPRLRPWAVAAQLPSAAVIPFLKKVDLNGCEPGSSQV